MTMNLSISRHLLCDTLNFSSPTCTYAKKTKVSFQNTLINGNLVLSTTLGL